MPLTPGTKLGSYEILAAIGAGGMGEVYRARDTKLGREVAIKVLPEAFAQNEERLARFEREARLLASLNHPNIATLYGLEQSDGVQFLVMELADGETLAERLRRGPIPVEDALPIFKQIAEALEAAHEKGIIHRDLKPANIKVSSEGKVKVLDFGLAKAMSGDPVKGEVSESPTITRDATATGVILGTAAYMSPEQARGKPVDKRTDIWAFGAVLYEALTGRVAFLGETVSDTIAGILKQEPEWRKLPENTPQTVRSLLRRCLNKDPSHRVQHIGDARIEIEESLTEVPGEIAHSVVVSESQQTPWKRVLSLNAGVLALIVALIAGGLALWATKRSLEPRPVARFALNLPGNQTFGVTHWGSALALSPDGTRVVYVGQEKEGERQLYVRNIDQLEATPIPGTEGAKVPFFSPDGQQVGFFADLKLKTVSVKGGAPITLCDAVEGIGGTWGEDSTIVFTGMWVTGLSSISVAGGSPEVLLPASAGSEMAWPQSLPGGQAILFTLIKAEDEPHIAVVSLETGEHRTLVAGVYALYAPTGHLVFAREGTLFAVPFDQERLEVRGTPTPVLGGINMHPPLGANFSFSNDGTLVYVPGHLQEGEERSLLLVDRNGSAQPLTEKRGHYETPRFSPDGGRIVVDVSGDIWVFDLGRRKLNRLTFTTAGELCPAWSPDGERLVFTSYRKQGGGGLFWKPADGSGPAERLTSTRYSDLADSQLVGSWSPDGNVLVLEQDLPKQTDIHILPMGDQHKPRPFTDTPTVNEFGPRLSPDGRWIAYMTLESGQREIYVQPFPAGGGKWQISSGGGDYAVWGLDGREIYYQKGSKLMVVEIETQPEFAVSEPRLVFENNEIEFNSGTIGFANYDISPDNQTFVMVGKEPPVTRFNVVLNWFEELKRLVPTN